MSLGIKAGVLWGSKSCSLTPWVHHLSEHITCLPSSSLTQLQACWVPCGFLKRLNAFLPWESLYLLIPVWNAFPIRRHITYTELVMGQVCAKCFAGMNAFHLHVLLSDLCSIFSFPERPALTPYTKKQPTPHLLPTSPYLLSCVSFHNFYCYQPWAIFTFFSYCMFPFTGIIVNFMKPGASFVHCLLNHWLTEFYSWCYRQTNLKSVLTAQSPGSLLWPWYGKGPRVLRVRRGRAEVLKKHSSHFSQRTFLLSW